MALQTALVSLYVAISMCVRAQGYGKLIVLLGTMPWLCGYHPLRIHIISTIWMSPEQGLTAVSELSRSETETDMICIAFFLHYTSRWAGCLSCYTTNLNKLPRLPPHSCFPSPTLLVTAIFHNHFQDTPNHVNTLKTFWAPGCATQSLLQLSVTD